MMEFRHTYHMTEENIELTHVIYRFIKEVFFLEDRIIADQSISIYVPDNLMIRAMGHVSTTALKS